jgi:hypothetical protein
MLQIEVNEKHIVALDKIYAKLGYKILNCYEIKDNIIIDIRVLDNRNYMLEVWLGYDNMNLSYYVYSAYAIETHDMGPECLSRWLDSAVACVRTVLRC